MGHYYQIGDKVIDRDGCKGYVCIRYDDGDLCFWENDAAHPNPKKYNRDYDEAMEEDGG